MIPCEDLWQKIRAVTQGIFLQKGICTHLSAANNIYFCGENINPQRLMNMTIRKTDGKTTLKCQKRNKWIKQLDKNMHVATVSKKIQKEYWNGTKLTNTHKRNFTRISTKKRIIKLYMLFDLNMLKRYS